MDKIPAPPPSLAKRPSSSRNAVRLSTKPETPSEGSSAAETHDAGSAGTGGSASPDKVSVYGLASSLSNPTAQHTSSATSPPSEPRIDRSVESRTQFQITLPSGVTSRGAAAGSAGDGDLLFDQRGWSSPHGEPYRPLGKPDLSLTFSPRLANGSILLHNAHRMKAFEGKDSHEKEKGDIRHAAHAKSSVHHALSANATAASGSSSGSGAESAPHPGLFEMFPLNFANRKRPLAERQVKLAHRLYTSTTHYSPEKVRGLRRSTQARQQQRELREEQTHLAPNASSNHRQQQHTHQGDVSVDLLRRAIQECSSRLRSVKNGASFLAQVPSSEHLDLLVLQEEYHRERAQHVSHDSMAGIRATGGARHKPFQHNHPGDDKIDFGHADLDKQDALSVASNHPSHTVDDDDFYLPYTTRHLQKSPHKRLPTFGEFKSKTREEKMPRALLSVHNNNTTVAENNPSLRSPSTSSPRRSVRTSHVAVSIGGHHHRSLDKPDSATSGGAPRTATSSSPRLRYSVTPASGNGATSVVLRNDSSSLGVELLPMSLRALKHKPKQQQKKLHGVERLQAAVDAIETAKLSHSKMLVRTVESLNQDRRDCMAVKFQHFSVQRHLDDDMQQMRCASESQRTENLDDTLYRSKGWYHDLLKQLLTRDSPLHPAESFLVRAIRRITNDGHHFDQKLFFRLILLLHRDDLLVLEVQHMLAHLRQALRVTPNEWETFCVANELVKIGDRKGKEQERKPSRLDRLRAVVTLNKAVRHFSKSE